MNNTAWMFLAGYLSGLFLGVVIVGWHRCRFRLHDWNRWNLSPNGEGQSRQCERCGLYQSHGFVGFRPVKPSESKEQP